MRVLHVMECTIGGTRRHLSDLVAGELAAGHEVGVVAAVVRDAGMAGDLERLKAAGARIWRLDMQRAIRPGTDWKHYRVLRGILREYRPDIVHSHSSKAGALARRASLAEGIGKRIHTPHTMAFLFSSLFSPRKRALFRWVEQRLARHTDRIIAVSGDEGETLRTSGVLDPALVRVVPNGIDPAPFQTAQPLDLAEFGFDPSRPTLAVVGLIYAAKGQDLAIEALAGLARRDVQLLLVGPGDTAPYEQLARERGVRERVCFTGARNDVPAILASVTALLLPSRWEGMPYVVLEAMAAGKPVLATPVDGARAAVLDGETGFLADAIDAPAVQRTIERLLALDEAGRAALGARASAEMQRHHSLTAMVQGTLDVYAEVL
ncbi:MAG: glycosyltransferase family 4 protein [Planctomycetota bacterium]